ncbi:hypothetical protein ACFYUJ_21130 [Streptomyces sp. NPDC004520]|uniref:hypothetical protein n=1 Tax=Streptomyces sp. NPDC004520 TaxID=3364702 RepID=UPI0036C66D3B
MPRIAVPYSNLVPNSNLADPAGTAVSSGAGNGGQVANAFAELTLLRVSNASGGSGTATLLAGSLPLAIAAGQGNLAVTVANAATQWIGPVESGRFLQNDGSLIVETTAAMTVTAFRVPRNT